ncbi:MAG TPA: hypothetical protein VHP33_18345 [Polyangiaceae bacterium]|nr:hypothetical protein [Polyangiaceae bacterium]
MGTSWQLEHFRPLLRPLPLLSLGFLYVHWNDGAPRAARAEPDSAKALVIALKARGLSADPQDVHFVPKSPYPWDLSIDRGRAVVRAHHDDDPCDIFAVETRLAPGGSLLEIDAIYNLSDTSAADEQNLVVSDMRAAWAIGTNDTVASVQFADFRGEPPPSGPGWNRPRIWQNAITNLQESGELAGIGRRAFKLEPAAYKVVLGFAKGTLLIDADSHKISISDHGKTLEGDRYVKEVTPPKARPGNFVTWAVDRVRALPWFGDERMQWLKAVAFGGRDQLEQIVSSVTGDDGSQTVKEELGDLFATGSVAQTNPETGWPPPPMEPMLDPPIPGEGKWGSLEKDPFVAKNPGAPCPFVFSFIRTDKKRMYSQVFVTLWDPRQVELHAMSGTVEPISATGETGPGQVPRDPQILKRFVGGFNGGFQAIHGEFGMMAEKTLYLPPKPYGATVAELDDGSTAFGSWPETPDVPTNIISFRQNMTALVENGDLNPWKRHWWGGLPPGWTEESRTVRSGLCMTKEGFVGYFYGGSVDPDVLGLAMQRAHCSYGIHLDMNPGHTGLEYYRAAPKGTLPKLTRKLDEGWEARGAVPGLQGWEFMSRRMMKFMALMNFPRYVNVEQRDFFYLTLREILPGEALTPRVQPAEPGEGAWRVEGLPQHGWPYAVATTKLRTDPNEPEFRIGLLKLDAKLVRVGQPGDLDPQVVVELRGQSEAGPGQVTLYHADNVGFHIAYEPRVKGAQRVTSGFPADNASAKDAQAVMGIDASGALIYARVAGGAHASGDGDRLAALLTELGCQTLLFLPRPVATLFGNAGEASNAPGLGVKLVRTAGPGARRLFPDTPIVKPTKWAPLQQKRVRYKGGT